MYVAIIDCFAVADRTGRNLGDLTWHLKENVSKHFGQAENIAILSHYAHRFAHSSIRDTYMSALDKWFFSDKRNIVKLTTH